MGVHAGEKKYTLYLDADFSHALASSESIERGFLIAIDETLPDHIQLDIVRKDHRGNSRRSLKNLNDFLKDSTALAVITGLHSPPVLSNLAFISANRILTLDPWAAAGPITRYSKGENWVFRLSVDDTKAGGFLIRKAALEGFKKPYLLLEETGWGRSNYNTMTRAIEDAGLTLSGVSWFNWSLGDSSARNLLRQARDADADVIMLVANTPEAVTLSQAMISGGKALQLPIRSHWGLTGGNYTDLVTAQQRAKLDLKFIQTRFSFLDNVLSDTEQNVLKRIQQIAPTTDDPHKTAPVTGFAHGYDLGLLFVQAMLESELTGDILQDRLNVRSALENLRAPVQGLVKLYQRPFQPFSPDQPDAHEALGAEDLVLGRFRDDGLIVIDE